MILRNPILMMVTIFIVLIVIKYNCKGIVTRKNKSTVFRYSLFQRGNPIVSKKPSFRIQRLESSSLRPHHSETSDSNHDDHGFIFFIDGEMVGGGGGGENDHQPDQPLPHLFQNVHTNSEDKRTTNRYYKLIYNTNIFENDRTDLYSLIGGLSFASVLATTLYLLNRNRGGSGNGDSSASMYDAGSPFKMRRWRNGNAKLNRSFEQMSLLTPERM